MINSETIIYERNRLEAFGCPNTIETLISVYGAELVARAWQWEIEKMKKSDWKPMTIDEVLEWDMRRRWDD